MTLFYRIFEHLLPRAKAWRLGADKRLTQFFEGLTGVGADARAFVDNVWLDVFPATTRQLDEWEAEFALRYPVATEQDRRDRLAARWQAQGGQDPSYIQATLRARGFDVYVHDWWVPGTEAAIGVHAAATPRDPTAHLGPGEDGYVLVNKVSRMGLRFLSLCGEPLMQCGEPDALCGNFDAFSFTPVEYPIPTDPALWPYFLYIGAETFPDVASIPALRQEEFEDLCLAISPCQLWLGLLVEYV